MNSASLAAMVEARYRGYLNTRYAFRDPSMREQFADLLRDGSLAKGPFLESTGSFPKGMLVRDFLEEAITGVVDEEFKESLNGSRHLYAHQEEALRRISLLRHNAVVATGTGSGKTETFLLPILVELYREHLLGTLDEPGVRALIIYPLNALAHDQRSRLGGIAQRLEQLGSAFSFTFGQYTGETPENSRDLRRSAQAKLDDRMQGEIVLREEMRSSPPHILLTNFSMLEYLLLRPADSPLFDGEQAKTWKFLVLDEAHQYNGALGMEIGMLVRRLKARLARAGCNHKIQCIGTSATIASSSDDRPSVAEFARSLFGEPFDTDDIVIGQRLQAPKEGTIDLSEAQLVLLDTAIESDEIELARNLMKDALGIEPGETAKLLQIAGTILTVDRTASKLRSLLRSGPKPEAMLLATLFPESPDGGEQLERLVRLLCSAEDPQSGAPLASLRFHHFLRALEGAFLYYSLDSLAWKLTLERNPDSPTMLFELSLCRECGQHFLVGKQSGNALAEAMHDSGDPEYGAEYFMPIDRDSLSAIDWQSQSLSAFLLDGTTGDIAQISSVPETMSQAEILLVRAKESPSHALRATACPQCGYSVTDPIRAIRPGKDGPHVVIATALHERLPEGRRRILAFADSRRDAARFAWLLEDSYKSVLSRSLLLKAIRRNSFSEDEPSSLEEAVRSLVDMWRSASVVPESKGNRALLRDAWISVYRELLSRDRQSSLSSTGLIQWSVQLPRQLASPEFLLQSPWKLSSSESLDLIRVLLGLAREQGAVELLDPQGSTVHWDELDVNRPQASFRIGEGDRRSRSIKATIDSWDSAKGRRVEYLLKLLREKMAAESGNTLDIAQDAARRIWQSLCEQSEGADGLLVQLKDSRRLNPHWWRCTATTIDSMLFVCSTCGSIQHISVADVCARYGCPGTLVSTTIVELAPNYYSSLYESELPPRMRVEEHTAQIEKGTARRFQKEFTEGAINVLSSSTTFELGVDLGELDVVFLRNVPPEVFNYAQRAGRSGRRAGTPGLVVTFCNRRPHDLYHFADPEHRLLNGRIPPPTVRIGNSKIVRRHVVAVAISAYLRSNPDRFNNVASLLEDIAEPTLTSRLSTFLHLNNQEVEKELLAIVPEDMVDVIGIGTTDWIQHVCGTDSRLSMAEAEISSDFVTLKNYQDESSKSEKFRQAGWAKARLRTIEDTDVLSFLSRKAVIPKYGFPVDVVELDLGMSSASKSAATVLLQRDLSIAVSEFAPTSRVIANKTIWESRGLKRVVGREWPVSIFRECRVHGVFESWGRGEKPPSEQCCDKAEEGKYVQPIFGFVGEEKGSSEIAGSQRVFSSRPYFIQMQDKDVELLDKGLFTITRAAPGKMVVLCRGIQGRGFYICTECGAAFNKRKREHKTPLGRKCAGTLTSSSLGHEFVTDVVAIQFNLDASTAASDSRWFAHSLAYALLEGTASALGVPRSNLDATVSNRVGHDFPEIILYDDVPGGAGLVAQLRHAAVLRRCLEEARGRVDGRCGCSEDQSCYGCLRSYRNQFAHRHLARGPVLELLNTVLDSLQAL